MIECDVRDQDSVDRRWPRRSSASAALDVLINNAGLGMPQSAGAAPDDDALRRARRQPDRARGA